MLDRPEVSDDLLMNEASPYAESLTNHYTSRLLV